MKRLLLLIGLATGCTYQPPPTPEARLAEVTSILSKPTVTDEERFYALNDAAKKSFTLGKMDDAKRYAEELLALMPKFSNNWNYGNAVQDGNVVLGRLAVRDDRIDDAKRHLLAAGNSPGSPQMNSFGPNMSLAKDLLAKGERDAVLDYFERCRKFWSMDWGKLDEWSKDLRAGHAPDFGANLVY
jgi:tetratricopeptide (TPR) repeat protein